MMNFALLTPSRMPGAVFRLIGNTFNWNIVAVNQSLTSGYQKRSIVTAITQSEVTKYTKSAPPSKWLQSIRYVHDFVGPKPEDYNPLILDVSAENLKLIGADLGYKYLCAGEVPTPAFPVIGRIYHVNRLIVPLCCQYLYKRDSPKLNVLFMVDTSSRFTYISQQVLDAFAKDDEIPQRPHFMIQGRQFYCSVSPSNFSEVNLLGMDYICKMNLSLLMNYAKREFHMIQSDAVKW